MQISKTETLQCPSRVAYGSLPGKHPSPCLCILDPPSNHLLHFSFELASICTVTFFASFVNHTCALQPGMEMRLAHLVDEKHPPCNYLVFGLLCACDLVDFVFIYYIAFTFEIGARSSICDINATDSNSPARSHSIIFTVTYIRPRTKRCRACVRRIHSHCPRSQNTTPTRGDSRS